VAAAVAAAAPKPDPETKFGKVYGVLYGLLNLLAFNFGNAKNSPK